MPGSFMHRQEASRFPTLPPGASQPEVHLPSAAKRANGFTQRQGLSRCVGLARCAAGDRLPIHADTLPGWAVFALRTLKSASRQTWDSFIYETVCFLYVI